MLNGQITVQDLNNILGYGAENVMELLYRLKTSGNKINGEDLKNLIYKELTKGVTDWQKITNKRKKK